MNCRHIFFVVLAVLLVGGVYVVANNDNSKCLALESQSDKFFCYRNLALEQKDVSLCKYVPAPKDGIGYDRESCEIYYASETKDISSCETIKTNSGKAFCYGGVVFAKGDPALCQTLNDQYYRDNCYKLYSTYGQSAYRNSKLEVYAHSESLCTKIVDPHIRASCTKEGTPTVSDPVPTN